MKCIKDDVRRLKGPMLSLLMSIWRHISEPDIRKHMALDEIEAVIYG